MKDSVIYQDIKQEGVQEGVHDTTRKLAVKMLENGIDASQVAAITGLTNEQVLALRKQ